MTVGQCVSDVCHNSALRSLCVPQQQRTAKVVGSNPNQAWNGWNVLSSGTLESREEPPYRPPPGLLGLIYGLSSGQEIPHFPSLGLFCNGKLHHLPNLWNIFMGKCGQFEVSNNPASFMPVRFDSVLFRLNLIWVIVYYATLKILSWMDNDDIQQQSGGINGKFIFHWIHVSLISPPPTPLLVLTMLVKQNCSITPAPSGFT